VFLDLEGFDPKIGGRKGDKNLQGGETELCARLDAEYGEKVWYEPEATVGHKVFKYRTDPIWLLDRAFWQGYSKRAMSQLVADDGAQESDFLRRLVFEFIPQRLSTLACNPSYSRLSQFFMLIIFTAAVGAGFVYGMIRY
jgi:hypothetical protein